MPKQIPGTKAVSVILNEATHKALRQYALDHGTSIQQILKAAAEGIVKQGRPLDEVANDRVSRARSSQRTVRSQRDAQGGRAASPKDTVGRLIDSLVQFSK